MRKNILIMCHHHATQFIDVCNQYVKLFDPKKYFVTVLYLTGAPDETVRERTLSEEVIFLNQSARSVRGLKLTALWKLYRLCRARQFDVVICHRYKPIYLFLWLGQIFRFKALFFVMHDLGTLKPIMRRLLIKLLLRKNMFFAGVSNSVRDDMRKSLGKNVPYSQVITLYNCIDVPTAKQSLIDKKSARAFFHLSDDAFVFGTLGRFVPAKDQMTMIRAFVAIKEQCPRAVLLLIGSGKLEETLKKAANEYQLTDRILFPGYVSEAYRYAHAFDVFMLTSVREAFGRVLPEVMIAKVPVIGTRTDGIPEVVDDAGILISPRDDRSLANAMCDLYQMNSEERLLLGEKGSQHIEKNFSLDKFVHDFWQLPVMKGLNDEA